MVGYFFMSVLSAYGLATALVDKQRQWPVRRPVLLLKLALAEVNHRLPSMLDCTACTSFWTALLCDVILLPLSGFHYWVWPLSGFAAFGFTSSVIWFLNSHERSNVILDARESNKE